jgi:hypothetical protein
LINQESIKNLSNDIIPIIKKVVWFVIPAIYIGKFISGMISLVWFFVLALLVWLLLVILKCNNGYMHSYRVTIHAMTPALIISSFINLNMFISPILLIIVVFVNFYLFKKTKKTEVS